jgi:hypothetical protein
MKISNITIDHHRNGVMGNPFSVAMFDMTEDGETRKMVAVLFGEPGSCAVLDVDMLSNHDILFGSNSWRGDHFEDELRAAIKADREGMRNGNG